MGRGFSPKVLLPPGASQCVFNPCHYAYTLPTNKILYFVAMFIHYNDGSFCIDRLNTLKST